MLDNLEQVRCELGDGIIEWLYLRRLLMKVSNYLDTKPVQELPGVVKREVISADDGAPRFCACL